VLKRPALASNSGNGLIRRKIRNS